MSTSSENPRESGDGDVDRPAADPTQGHDEDLPLDQDLDAIRTGYFTVKDMWNIHHVPEKFIYKMRKTRAIRITLKTAGGAFLIELEDASRIVSTYWNPRRKRIGHEETP